jgi:hypothetical protein
MVKSPDPPKIPRNVRMRSCMIGVWRRRKGLVVSLPIPKESMLGETKRRNESYRKATLARISGVANTSERARYWV